MALTAVVIIIVRSVHLHEGDEQEEGVGSPPDLLVQEPGQEREHPILGCAAGGDREEETLHSVYIQQMESEPDCALAKVGIHA